MKTRPNEPIAIIGSGCRFPGGSSSPSKLWELLAQPRDLSREIPPERFNAKGFYHPNGEHHGSANVLKSYLLDEDPRQFDAQFFNINPREAECIDPQQRILLETVYEAMESAGQTIEGMQGSNTAVYVGLMCLDYYDVLARDVDSVPQYFATGTARSIISNRVSYFFDWHGPSMTIDTACSSSLVALHQAVETLRSGTSRVAVVAGANMIFGPENYISESKLHMLSPSGHSQMWDVNADGYARGEGICALVLKPLSQAIADRDHIECIIRETGVNQDGRTKGITMPSPISQKSLIRQTYEKAGLDWRSKKDRCQYFEAHGTGTQAGDPIEAEAVKRAFFDEIDAPEDDILYIGSVKTIIGHLEGAAGLAGVLKASLALQHGVIPPNLHFKRLNPKIEPFYTHLRIPTQPTPWPAVEQGVPRRASVNSFGFGGTNAHAILENYDPHIEMANEVDSGNNTVTPLVFSSNSEKSLLATVDAFSKILKENEDVKLGDLAWTLHARRTVFPYKITFSGVTKEDLCKDMDAELEKAKASPGSTFGTFARPRTTESKVLGVFTGQGAQWPTMGARLIVASKLFRETIEMLEQSLNELPEAPSWSLKEEIMAGEANSRLSEAALSQPLCSAVQIALVNLLRASGVSFTAVVGHSSGEIAAAYTAGFLSATDAIRIAYYRGIYAKLASGQDGCKGAMMAAGMSMADAQALCNTEEFKGRVAVAASNAPSSVTLSGDEAAIKRMKEVLDSEKKFARLLKVDTAYHSHHMHPCAGPYVAALQRVGIQVLQPPAGSPVWYSSVHDRFGSRVVKPVDELKDDYWKENMVNAVLFSQAVEAVTEALGPFDLAVEVGPHPALKGPATQTYKKVTGNTLPYHGALDRGKDDIRSFSALLGFLWTQLGPSAVNFDGHRRAFTDVEPRLVKGLPGYAWDHEKIFWRESRISKRYRTRETPVHELLGSRRPDDTESDLRWRNFLSLKEIPWIRDHSLQGQAIFPGAGYVCMVLEAVNTLVEEEISLIEIQDLVIHKAIIMNEDPATTEVVFNFKRIDDPKTQSTMAEFTCYSGSQDDSMQLVFNGKVSVTVGADSRSVLPPRTLNPANMIEFDIERFYDYLKNIGYGYAGDFTGMRAAKRATGKATGYIVNPSSEKTGLIFHPAMLDVAFQSIFAAFASPADGRFTSLHVPTDIKRICVNPQIARYKEGHNELLFDTFLTEASPGILRGDIEIFDPAGQQMLLQVESVRCVPLQKPDPSGDRPLFARNTYEVDISGGHESVINNNPDDAEELELIDACERVSFYYLRQLIKEVRPEEHKEIQPHHQKLLNFANELLSTVENGKHQSLKKEWSNDTREDVLPLMQRYSGYVDMDIICAVGENLASVVLGDSTMLEHMMKDDLLERFYEFSTGYPRASQDLANAARQISYRYPRLNFLEIGAGSGAATKKVLDSLDGSLSSYTYTDISTGYLEKAQERFKDHGSVMRYKTLDIEKDILEQGFEEGSFDVIIASNVLYATSKLSKTLENVRRLLKPGGYLLVLEITTGLIRMGFIMGGLPGWWLGAEDGRPNAPHVSPVRWNSMLRKAGFSGIDTISRDLHDHSKSCFSTFATQAIDPTVNFLRRPLNNPSMLSNLKLLIIGGNTLSASLLVEELMESLSLLPGSTILAYETIEQVDMREIPSEISIISATELDEPMFKSMNAEKLSIIQQLLARTKNILWLTQGRRAANPFSAMTYGLIRPLAVELPSLRFQFLDIEVSEKLDANLVAETFLRLCAADLEDVQKVLWTTEPELLLENGKIWIPRVLPDKAKNDRLNSARRHIVNHVDPTVFPVEISLSEKEITFRDGNVRRHLHNLVVEEDMVSVRVKYSIISPLMVSKDTQLFLSLGTDTATGETVVSLSQVNSSIIEVPKSWTFVCEMPEAQEVQYLRALACNLTAIAVLDRVPPNSAVIAHEPDSMLASILSELAAQKNIYALFTTSKSSNTASNWIYIHPLTPERVFRAVLPDNVHTLVNFSADSSPDSVGKRVANSLPHAHKIRCAFATWNTTSGPNPINDIPVVKNAMLEACQKTKTASISDVVIIPASELAVEGSATKLNAFTIIDWTTSKQLPVAVEAINTSLLFSKNKTYLLVGLTGDLGKSLCEWMVQQGAGNILLTSRNPKVDKDWIEMLHGMGGNVAVASMDVLDRSSIQRLQEEFSTKLPPIAGIVQGAMVLNDKLFMNMSYDDLDRVLKPKVYGSINLHEQFKNDTLDFFVFLSSLSPIVGNAGQSNYNAANMFMTALAAQRRKQGLVASVIDLGMVVGVGVVARTGRALEESLRKNRYMPISETDFHQIFTEAVISGRPESHHDPEVVTGLELVVRNDNSMPHWTANPRFSHWVIDPVDLGVEEESDKNVAPLSVQLAGATTKEQVYEIIKTCFAMKIEASLQLAPGSVNELASLIELGVDSLVAVEVRSWFLKNLGTDMPVLKILGGATVKELCTIASEQMPTTLTPKLGSSSEKAVPAVTTSATAAEKTVPTITIEDSLRILPTEQPSATLSSTHSSSSTDRDFSRAPTESSNSSAPSSPKLPKADEKAVAPPAITRTEVLSSGQSRFWFSNVYLEDKTTANVAIAYRLIGKVNVAKLDKAVQAVAERHESLRTSYIDNAGEAVQGLMEKSILKLETGSVGDEGQFQTEFSNIANHVFDLEHGSVMRVALFSQSLTQHYIVFAYHHIALDGYSFGIFMQDLQKEYTGVRTTPLKYQYTDFTLEQKAFIRSAEAKEELKFWKNEFATIPEAIPLFPFSRIRTRKPLERHDSHRVELRIEPAIMAKVKQASIKARATPFHFCVALLEVLVHRFLGVNDFAIGIADANRMDTKYAETIGMFLNLLPLRFNVDGQQKFIDLVGSARAKVYSALMHSKTPIDILIEELNIPRSPTHNPLFQVLLNYRAGAPETIAIGDCELQNLEAYTRVGRTPYDLTLDIMENPNKGALISLMLQKSLYTREDTEMLLRSFVHLLQEFASDPTSNIKDKQLFPESEISRGIELACGQRVPAKWAETLAHHIHDVVEKNEDKIAVKDGRGNTLTYRDMANRANSIAKALLAAGVRESARVGVYLEPSSDSVCSLLAIMQIGAVYIPLDIRQPIERLSSIVRDGKPSVVIAHSATLSASREIVGAEATVLNTDEIITDESEVIPISATPEAPGFILYTSGSTGTPKGITLKHSSFRNQIENVTNMFGLGAETVMQQSSVGFDMSLDQIFVALCNGGSVYVVPKEKRGDPIEITNIISQEAITYTMAAPSEYLVWIRYGGETLKSCTSWKFAFSGGEALTDLLKKEFKSLALSDLHLFNVYGPTEVCISSHRMDVPYNIDFDSETPDDFGPVGFTLPNYSIYIVDENLKPVPAGMVGEILIGGAGIGQGYVDENLSKAKYLPDPFATAEDKALGWTRLYRSGDKGRLRHDGALIFLGRMDGDTQIKLRGLRIELEDVRNAILQAAKDVLSDVAVTVRGDPAFLVAHATFSSGQHPEDAAQYLKQLRTSLPLPQYMWPAVIIPLDKMPLNPNGKTDRNALRAMEIPEILTDSQGTTLSESEESLKTLWKEAIGSIASMYDIDRDTDFFGIGGNSMLLVRLQAAIRTSFNVNIPLVEMFRDSTLGGMAAKLSSTVNDTLTNSAIDWEAETAYENSTIPQIEPTPHDGKIVLLTGSTGFLGRAILQQLINDPTVTKIHCVAIRAKSRNISAATSESRKIHRHLGDLSAPLLGLRKPVFDALASEVDVIIHNGADVSFLKSYHSLRKANVESTKTLAKLALPRCIPFHFVSTGGVQHLTGSESPLAEVSVAQFLPPTDGSRGYESGKWASEQYLENVAAATGLPICIHRPTSIIGDGAPELDIMHNLITFSQKIKALPDMLAWKMQFDFVKVEDVAGGIHSFAVQDGLQGVKFVNHCAEKKLNLDELKASLEKDVGSSFEYVGLSEWVDRAGKEGMNVLVAEYIGSLGKGSGHARLPSLVKGDGK